MNANIIEIPTSTPEIPPFDKELVALTEGSILGAIAVLLIIGLWREHLQDENHERKMQAKFIDFLMHNKQPPKE